MDQGHELPSALEQIADEKSPNQKPKFFNLADYQKILNLQQDNGDGSEVSFEDALEAVMKTKLQQNFPQVADKFYNQKTAKRSWNFLIKFASSALNF